jgi:hypothetical protein
MFPVLDAACTAADGRAVVVTVSVVPEMEQPPAGIAQLAVSVGFVLNPLSLIWNVKVLPAAPVCDGSDGVTVGAAANVAMTLVFAVIANVQTGLLLPDPAPMQALDPDQLVNVAFVPGTAVNMIVVPELKLVPLGVC